MSTVLTLIIIPVIYTLVDRKAFVTAVAATDRSMVAACGTNLWSKHAAMTGVSPWLMPAPYDRGNA